MSEPKQPIPAFYIAENGLMAQVRFPSPLRSYDFMKADPLADHEDPVQDADSSPRSPVS